jgi:hypothetical protein
MKCWIVVYNHRFGIDTWPVFQAERPSEEEIIAKLKEEEEWDEREEQDEESWVEVRGSWDLPAK